MIIIGGCHETADVGLHANHPHHGFKTAKQED
jgi:hypothetical protein